MTTPYTPEWNKTAGTPYATLGKYYHTPVEQKSNKNIPSEYAAPVFGGVGYNEKKKGVSANADSCHSWRVGDYDGRVLSKYAYPQCGPESDCNNYSSRY
jgi:hypothetical protein